MSCTLNNLAQECALSVSGLSKIWMLPFGDITNLVYDPNTLSKVEDYQLLSIPTYLPVSNESSFISTMEYTDTAQRFTHVLEITLYRSEPYKREEIEKLRRQEYSIIFSDRNKNCRFIGETAPVSLISFEETSGQRGSGMNGYKLRFESRETNQAKFISCFDSECFSSFVGSELRRSVFILDNASSLVALSPIQVVADTSLLTGSGTISPAGWITPSVVNTDIVTINSILGTRGQVEALLYDPVQDLAVISLVSVDTQFDYFKAFTTNPYRSVKTRLLYLDIITGTVAAGSIVTVTDSFSNVLYSGLISDPISAIGISGTVGSAVIEVSTLYSTDVTFTASITGTTCTSRQYIYEYESLTTCDTAFSYSVSEGTQYEITFTKYDFAPLYRRMSLHYGDFTTVILGDASNYTSDFSVFEHAVISGIQAWQSDITPSTIRVIDNGSTVTIMFQASNTNSYFYAVLYGNDLTYTNDLREATGNKTVLLNMVTTTAQQDIAIRQSGSLIEGVNNQPPTTVTGFILEEVSGVANITNNVNIVLNPFVETAQFQTDVSSANCPVFSNLQDITTCVTESTPSNGGVLHRLEYTVSGPAEIGFSLWEIRNGSTPLGNFVTSNVNPNNFEGLAFNFNEWGLGLHSAQFSWAQNMWILEVWAPVEYSALRIDIDGSPAFTLSTLYNIADCNFDAVLHPAITLDYNIPTIDGSFPIINYSGHRADSPVYHFVPDVFNIATLAYNAGTGDLDITVNNTNGTTGDFVFELYNTLPTPTNSPMISYTLSAGTTLDTKAYQADLSALGFAPTDTAFVVVRSSNGFYMLKQYVIAVNPSVSIDETMYYKVLWGRGQQFWVLCSDWSAYTYTWGVNSILCPLFSPLALGNDLLLWIRPEAQVRSWLTQTTRTLTNGSLTYTGTSTLVPNALVSFDAGVTYYRVVNVVGSTITLNRPISEPSGPHIEFTCIVQNLTDSSPYNRTCLGNGIRYYLENIHGGYAGIYVSSAGTYSLSPITMSDPNSLDMFSVARSAQTGSANILFAHRSSTNALVQFNVLPTTWNATGQFRDSSGATLQTATATTNTVAFPAFNMYSHSFVQGISPANDSLQVWNNGDYTNRGTALANMTGTFTSTQQIIGGFSTGSIQPGFAGTFQELIVTVGLSLADKQKMEGYIAWKYGMTANLPSSHPYKTVRP